MNRNGVMVVVLLLLAYCFWPATPPVPAPVAPVPVKPVEPAKPKVPKPCPGPFCPKEDAAAGAI